MSRSAAVIATCAGVVAALLLASQSAADEVGPGSRRTQPQRSYETAQEMAERYRERAEAGDAAAQSRLAILYRTGRGVPQSDERAFHWMQRAAQGGDSAAQHYLGLFYLSGVGTDVDLDRGAVWLRRCAELDEPQSLLELAGFELAGLSSGVLGIAVEGSAVVRNAAERGLVEAQRALAALESDRDEPVAEETGLDWLRRSAEAGSPEAQYQLGLVLYAGRSTEPDPEQAVSWFERAAQQGDGRAMRRLGIARISGRGASQDAALAYRWFWLAARHGDALSQQDAAQLEAILSGASGEAAREQAQAWERSQQLAR